MCLPEIRDHAAAAADLVLAKLFLVPCLCAGGCDAQVYGGEDGGCGQCPINDVTSRRTEEGQQEVHGDVACVVRTQKVREEFVPRQLIVLVLGAQAVEVGMVEVLEHLSRQDGRDEEGRLPAQAAWGRIGTLCNVLLQLYPDSHIDCQVEHKPQ